MINLLVAAHCDVKTISVSFRREPGERECHLRYRRNALRSLIFLFKDRASLSPEHHKTQHHHPNRLTLLTPDDDSASISRYPYLHGLWFADQHDADDKDSDLQRDVSNDGDSQDSNGSDSQPDWNCHEIQDGNIVRFFSWKHFEVGEKSQWWSCCHATIKRQ